MLANVSILCFIYSLLLFIKKQKILVLLSKYDTICMLPPLYRQGKGGVLMNLITSFLVSIVASVIAYYICKWLDTKL